MKISYVGYSQGTIIMFYALSYAPYATKYISQFIALSPCFISHISGAYVNSATYNAAAVVVNTIDMETYFGPNWPE